MVPLGARHERKGEPWGRGFRVLYAFALITAFQTAKADPIDDLIKASMAKDHILGVAVGIIRDGKLLTARAYGSANFETNTPVTTETVFRIASMSKQFCAASILMLQAEGKLSIDDPISKYIEGTPETWSKVTLRHLLGHQSGIPDILSVKGFSFETRDTQKSILALLRPLRLSFAPGEKFSYSNSGYYLLGWVVEKVSGQPLADFARERLFKPAGMDKTSYFRVGNIVPNRAAGYYWKEDHYENALPTRPTVGDGSGAVLTTLGDWAKWDAALDVGAPLSKSIQAAMTTGGMFNDGTKSKYGFGWYDDGGGAVHHTGSTHGFTSAFIRDPKRHLTVVVLRNSGANGSLKMAQDVLAAFSPSPRQTLEKGF
jgi:D-alanyl-D-alanine carboxypeptidase